MKHTKPMRSTDHQRGQPPVQTIEHTREISGDVGNRLPRLVGVPREPGCISTAVILPTRSFLAITYLYADIQKFTDPQFFNPTNQGVVGEEMRGYVRSGSLLSPLLTHLVIPHAVFDPAHNAQMVRGPARRPLAAIPVQCAPTRRPSHSPFSHFAYATFRYTPNHRGIPSAPQYPSMRSDPIDADGYR